MESKLGQSYNSSVECPNVVFVFWGRKRAPFLFCEFEPSVLEQESVDMSFVSGEFEGLLSVAHGAIFTGQRGDARFVQLSVAPVEIHDESTTGTQSFHSAVAPRVGQ